MDRYDKRAAELLPCTCGGHECFTRRCGAFYRERLATELRRMGAELDGARRVITVAARLIELIETRRWEIKYSKADELHFQEMMRAEIDLRDALLGLNAAPSPAVVERAVNLFKEHKHDA